MSHFVHNFKRVIFFVVASIVSFLVLLLKNELTIEVEDVAKSTNKINNDESTSFYSSCLNNAHVKRLSKWLNLDQIDVGGDHDTAPIDYDPTRKR